MNAGREPVGTIGERLQLLGNVFFVKVLAPKEKEWSHTYLVKLRDDLGHTIKTFYSGHKWLPEIGQRVELVGTVKEHDRYNGYVETELTRTKASIVGLAPGFTRTTRAPLPRAEELRWQAQTKAQRDFYARAARPPNAR
jgi:hypothetical protein